MNYIPSVETFLVTGGFIVTIGSGRQKRSVGMSTTHVWYSWLQ